MNACLLCDPACDRFARKSAAGAVSNAEQATEDFLSTSPCPEACRGSVSTMAQFGLSMVCCRIGSAAGCQPTTTPTMGSTSQGVLPCQGLSESTVLDIFQRADEDQDGKCAPRNPQPLGMHTSEIQTESNGVANRATCNQHGSSESCPIAGSTDLCTACCVYLPCNPYHVTWKF